MPPRAPAAAPPLCPCITLTSRTLTHHCPRPAAVPFDEAQNIAQRAGFSLDDFARFLEDYESLNVIQVNASRTRIDLATSGL